MVCFHSAESPLFMKNKRMEVLVTPPSFMDLSVRILLFYYFSGLRRSLGVKSQFAIRPAPKTVCRARYYLSLKQQL